MQLPFFPNNGRCSLTPTEVKGGHCSCIHSLSLLSFSHASSERKTLSDIGHRAKLREPAAAASSDNEYLLKRCEQCARYLFLAVRAMQLTLLSPTLCMCKERRSICSIRLPPRGAHRKGKRVAAVVLLLLSRDILREMLDSRGHSSPLAIYDTTSPLSMQLLAE